MVVVHVIAVSVYVSVCLSVCLSVCVVHIQTMNYTAESRHAGATLGCTVSVSYPAYSKTASTTLKIFSK